MHLVDTECPNGEGDGTPLQYSCLENPMDGGAWWAAVHGVSKTWTRLSDFTFTFHFHALEKEMATHSSVLAWRIPGTGEPGGLPSMGSHSRTRLKRLSSSSSRTSQGVYATVHVACKKMYTKGIAKKKKVIAHCKECTQQALSTVSMAGIVFCSECIQQTLSPVERAYSSPVSCKDNTQRLLGPPGSVDSKSVPGMRT